MSSQVRTPWATTVTKAKGHPNTKVESLILQNHPSVEEWFLLGHFDVYRYARREGEVRESLDHLR